MKLKEYSLLLIYVLVSLLIGEFHPFSSYEMYNSFPSTARVFSLNTAAGNIIPLQQYFNYHTADLSHNYSAIEAQNQSSSKTGEQLFNQLFSYRFNALAFDTVVLNKIELHFNQQELKVASTPIYEYHP